MTDSPELDYGAICIDTSIFHQTGYALEKGLLGQLSQFSKSPVKVIISEIVDREITQHLAERINEARALFEKGLRKVQQEMLVSEKQIKLAEKAILTGRSDEDIAKDRLKDFYSRCGVDVISVESVPSAEIIERYFNSKPPFEASGNKKTEFPDAYALVGLNQWATDKNLKVVVVSDDNGWHDFCKSSERLIALKDLGAALKLFQPHNAAHQLISDLNNYLLAGPDPTGIDGQIVSSISEAISLMEIDVNAESRFYWEASDVHGEYQDHDFYQISPGQIAIDLVRVTEHEVVVRLMATITCEVSAGFALSMTDPIDKDEISMGSQDMATRERFESDILLTFTGDFSQGLAGVSIKNIEILESIPTVEFGEIELDPGEDYYIDSEV